MTPASTPPPTTETWEGYIASLIEGAPHPDSIESLARIVKDKAVKRAGMSDGVRITFAIEGNVAHPPSPWRALMDWLRRR